VKDETGRVIAIDAEAESRNGFTDLAQQKTRLVAGLASRHRRLSHLGEEGAC